MNEDNKIAAENAEWERMFLEHLSNLGLDINGGHLEAQRKTNSTRRPQSILRYEALKKNKRLINLYRKRGFSLRYIFDMLLANGKIDYGYATFCRYVAKFETATSKPNYEDSENATQDLAAPVDKIVIADSETEVFEARNSRDRLTDKQYPDNYVGFKFNPNPDKENLI